MIDSLEQNLINRCKDGDSSSFGSLIKLYRKQLYGYLFRLLGERTIAEDVFQEVLIKTWKAIRKYSDEQKFSSWLFTIAHNCSMDELRKRKKENFFVEHDDQVIEDNTNLLKEMEKQELIAKINSSINLLTTKQKNVLLLRIEGELSYKEIAKVTNEPLNTVLSHMNYSIKKIRKSLTKHYE